MSKCIKPQSDASYCQLLRELVDPLSTTDSDADACRSDDIDTESIMEVLDSDGDGRTTWRDYYEAMRPLPLESRLSPDEFSDLTIQASRIFGLHSCGDKDSYRFRPDTMISVEGASSEASDFLRTVEEESYSNPVALYFYADWCDKCVPVKQKLAAIARDNPYVTIYSVNIDKDDGLCEELQARFGVTGVPYAALYSGGRRTFKGYGGELPGILKRADGVSRRRPAGLLDRHMTNFLGRGWWNNTIASSSLGELLTLDDKHPLRSVLGDIIVENGKKLEKLDVVDRAEQERLFDDIDFSIRSFKSAVALYDLADVAAGQTDLRKKRSVDILVPACGHHVAPLVTAIRLFERGEIDEAHFTFTEIDEKAEGKILKILERWSTSKEQLSRPQVVERRDGENGGKVSTILAYWRGKPITIDLKIKDSPEGKYFSPEDAENADVIVLHDVGYYSTTPDDVMVLPDVLLPSPDAGAAVDVSKMGRRIVAINEFGDYSGFISPFFAKKLKGDYGHSHSVKVYSSQVDVSAKWHEASDAPMLGLWMSIERQPLMKALRSREEAEHLIDLGIGAYDLLREDLEEKPVRFHIREGDIEREDLDLLFDFGMELQGRVKGNRPLDYLLVRFLVTALEEGGEFRSWAKERITALGQRESYASDDAYEEFHKSLDTLYLVSGGGNVSAPNSWIQKTRWLKREIDGYLILK